MSRSTPSPRTSAPCVELVLQPGPLLRGARRAARDPGADVRARAHAGLRALAPDAGLPATTPAGSPTGCSGQQPEAEAERPARGRSRRRRARRWAAAVAERLREVGGAAVPGVPEGEAAPAARPRPLREAPRRPPRPPPRGAGAGSPLPRLGGAILIAVLVAAGRRSCSRSSRPAGTTATNRPPAPRPRRPPPDARPRPRRRTGNDIVLHGHRRARRRSA